MWLRFVNNAQIHPYIQTRTQMHCVACVPRYYQANCMPLIQCTNGTTLSFTRQSVGWAFTYFMFHASSTIGNMRCVKTHYELAWFLLAANGSVMQRLPRSPLSTVVIHRLLIELHFSLHFLLIQTALSPKSVSESVVTMDGTSQGYWPWCFHLQKCCDQWKPDSLLFFRGCLWGKKAGKPLWNWEHGIECWPATLLALRG